MKQSLHEFGMERDDEQVICVMQTELLSRCIMSVLKGAIHRCFLKKRKFINVDDVRFGAKMSLFPFAKMHHDGLTSDEESFDQDCALLDYKKFSKIANEHIDFYTQWISQGVEAEDLQCKIGSEAIDILQFETEGRIRGFVKRVKEKSGDSVNIKTLSSLLTEI